MNRLRSIAVSLGIGLSIAGCAAHADRAAVAPTEVVYIAADLTATCDAGPREHFEYEQATASPHRPVDCYAAEMDDDTVLDIPEGAPADKRARAITRYLSRD